MPRQTNFNSGELAPELWGRTDLGKYAGGLRRCRNFIPIKQGAAMSRPGTRYCGPVKGGDVVSNSSTKIRLVPFIYSTTSGDSNFVCEFGGTYVRFWQAGAVAGGGTPVEVVTPYLEAELAKLSWAQTGAVLTLCHPSHPPAELSYDGTTFTYAAINFSRPACTATPTLLRSSTLTSALIDATHVSRAWQWQVTEVRRSPKGFMYETAPVTAALAANVVEWVSTTAYVSGNCVTFQGHLYAATGSSTGSQPDSLVAWSLNDGGSSLSTYTPAATDVVYPDRPRTIALRGGTAGSNSDPLISSRVYRGRQGVFGWVGDTTGVLFVDVGDEPDFSQAPPSGRNPFQVYNSSGTLTRTEYPAAVSFFEERRVFARTTERPGFLFCSATGDYANFDRRLVPVADEELEFELAARRREEVRSLLGLPDKLLAFTNGSVWAVGGSNGPMTFDSIDAHVQSSVGAEWLEPLPVDGAALYVRSQAAGVRAIGFDWQRQGYASLDLSMLSQHLFLGRALVDWTHAENPWGVVWAVRDDGVLLSLTYNREQQVWAWARHDTAEETASGASAIENVCAIPEGGEDFVYLVTRRTCNDSGGTPRTCRYIERFDSRVLALSDDGTVNATEAHALDCSMTYRGAVTNNITGLDYIEGATVYAVADGAVVGPLTVTSGAVDLGLSGGGAVVAHVGLPFTPELETLDMSGDRVKQKTVVSVGFELHESKGVSVGQDFDHLDTPAPEPAFEDFTAKVYVQGSVGASARAVLRQSQPLPVTVLGLTVEVEGGG